MGVLHLYAIHCLDIKDKMAAHIKHWRRRAIAQVVSRRLPKEATRIRPQVRSHGTCGGRSGTGSSSFRLFRFLLPILIPLPAPY
jgi:hypothetical protein